MIPAPRIRRPSPLAKRSGRVENRHSVACSESIALLTAGKGVLSWHKDLQVKLRLSLAAIAALAWPAPNCLSKKATFVFITGRRQAELDAAVKSIGRNVVGVQGDVSKLADIDRLFATVKQQKGQIDILFANAGVLENLPIGEITEEHFDRMFDINVKGVLFTVQTGLPIVKDGGSIILTASVAASKAFPAASVYCASKAAVRSFARTWTLDLTPRKIRVNVVSPGRSRRRWEKAFRKSFTIW